MKSVFLWALLLCSVLQARAQVVAGKVYRLGTDESIPGASVYYGGSMTGTSTDNNGNFQLQAQAQQIPIIVSSVGYYSSTVTYKPGEPLIVYLKPKTEVLRSVTIRVDGMSRKDEIKLFTKEFIGTSTFARSCSITNIDDIDLFYSKKTKTLTANCDKPIIIENKKLGYTISYFLDSFSWTTRNVSFVGNFIFKENIPTAADSTKTKRNRETAYKNSRMQFIRALWNHQLKQAGFGLLMRDTSKRAMQRLTADQILVIDSLHQQYVHLNDKLYIINDLLETSTVKPTQKFSYINKNGFYGAGLQWSGIMAQQRIGDLLPFEYRSEKEIKLYGEADTTPAQPAQPKVTAATPARPASGIIAVEKAYLHTDRDVYAQGEDIWFKAYLVNGRDNTPATNSRLLHVELIDPNSKIVASRLLRLADGLGSGDFKLADTISTGSYRIRAYTNWMRNFGDDFIFEKNIRILGTARAPLAAVTKKMKRKAIAAIAQAPAVNSAPAVRFFPEGGSIISGLAGIVAVRAEDGNGRGVAVTGKVVNNENEMVAGFTCDSLGFGAFTLLPDAAQHYQALVTIGGANSPFILPQVLAEGFTMNVQNKDQVTMIRIACNASALNKTNGQQLLLTARHGGQTYLKKAIPLSSGQLLVNIPDELLPEGISVITLSDEKLQSLCERLVYISHPGIKPLSVTTDKAVYQPKETVTVKLSSNATGIAHLSLAAVDAGTVPVQPGNIVAYLNLQSEIRGGIEDAGRYFDTTNVNRFKQMDLLLLTQGWRNFVWKRLEDTTLKITYKAEQGINITGSVTKLWANKPVPGVGVMMNASGMEGQKSFTTVTDSAGRFTFPGAVFYGYQYINFFARKPDDKGNVSSNSGGIIAVDSLFQDLPPVKPAQPDVTINNDAEELSAIEAIKRKLNLKADHNLKEVKIRASTSRVNVELPPQVHQITMVEHKEYSNLAQYLLNMINGVKLIARDCWRCGVPTSFTKNGTPIIMYDQGNSRILTRVGIQGIYADHSAMDSCLCQGDFLNLSMKNILKVTIVPIKTAYGMKYRVDLILRPGVMEVKDFFDNTMADMVGYYKAREFYKPTQQEMNNNLDTRTNTIHWEPDITTNEKGEATVNFYNTTQKGNMRLVVEGITDTGTPLVSTIGYEVK